MNDEQREASSLVATGLSAMRVGTGALRAADAALAVRPTNASNARWFMRAFVVRRAVANVSAVELFWTNLELARDQFAACDASLSLVFRDHADLTLVMQLQTELGAAGYDSIRQGLHEIVGAGEEADASVALRPTVARMRVCESRMLAAIRELAAAGRPS